MLRLPRPILPRPFLFHHQPTYIIDSRLRRGLWALLHCFATFPAT